MLSAFLVPIKIGPGFWSRVPVVGPGFYSFPHLFWVKRRTIFLAMPPRKSTRQNSKVDESDDGKESEVSRPAFQAKDATQWMMFLSGKSIFPCSAIRRFGPMSMKFVSGRVQNG